MFCGGDFRLSVRREKPAADADNAATEFVKSEGNMAGMRGEMSQMVAERPNAGAVRHYDRCGVIRRPRGQGFVPVATHGITPIVGAAGPCCSPAMGSSISACPSVRLRAFLSGVRVILLVENNFVLHRQFDRQEHFVPEGATHGRAAARAWLSPGVAGPPLKRPHQPGIELRPSPWPLAAQTGGLFRGKRRVCRGGC